MQALQHGQLLAPGAVFVIPGHLIRERVATRERGGEDYAGVVAHGFGQYPAVRQLGADGRCLVTHHERNAGVAQGIDSGGNRQGCDAVEGEGASVRNSEFGFNIESAAAARQLDDVLHAVDGLELASVFVLHQPGDVFVEHGAAKMGGNRTDELVASEDASQVGIIEDALGSRQPEGCAGNHHRSLR